MANKANNTNNGSSDTSGTVGQNPTATAGGNTSRDQEIRELTEREGRGELTTEEATRLKQLQDEADAENA